MDAVTRPKSTAAYSVVVLSLCILATSSSEAVADGGSECDGLAFVSRQQWGARRPRGTPVRLATPVKLSFVHHTETPGCGNVADCAKLLRGIQAYHMDNKGWSDIGYSFLIGGDGRVYEGRGWDVVGAHTYGYNSVALGFCVIGNYTTDLPTKDAVVAAKDVLKCGIEKGHIIESYELFGHRDGGYTECPGDALYKLIHSWPNFSNRKIPKRRPSQDLAAVRI